MANDTTNRTGTPVVLLGTLPQIPKAEPVTGTRYCHEQQLWIDADGVPIVMKQANSKASDFGETTVTLTREGIDQTESEISLASDYGETTFTKTSEGHDATEVLCS